MADTYRFWIAFGDIHEQMGRLGGISDLESASAVLISGDMTNVGDVLRAQRVLDPIKQRNARVFAQIGNMDTASVDSYLTEQGMNVHCRVVDLGGGVCLAAVGYSTHTPFGTPSEVDDTQLGAWLEDVLPRTKDFEQVILMVHNPPFKTATDRIPSGASVGSQSVRAAIEKFQPAVVVVGHIHESRAVDRIGKSIVINPGSFAQGGYVRISESAAGLVAELRSAS